MDLHEFKTSHYLFDPKDFGRIFAYVDFGNVRPWAKDLWPEENKFKISVEVDIAKLAEICDWVSPHMKFFYYGHFGKDQGLEKYNKSVWRIDKAEKAGFRVKTKPVKMIPHYDEDGSFAGKFPKCNIVCTRNRMSRELETVADKFIPAESLSSFLKYTPKIHPPER